MGDADHIDDHPIVVDPAHDAVLTSTSAESTDQLILEGLPNAAPESPHINCPEFLGQHARFFAKNNNLRTK